MRDGAPALDGLACDLEAGVPVVRFSGTVGLDAAPALLDGAAYWVAHQDSRDFRVDLSDVSRATSVLLAMLLELTEIARVWEGRMTVSVRGEEVPQLADFYGVRELLVIEGHDEARGAEPPTAEGTKEEEGD